MSDVCSKCGETDCADKRAAFARERELCRLSGVSFTYICQLEGKRQNVPTVDKAFRLADALGVSIYAITTRRRLTAPPDGGATGG